MKYQNEISMTFFGNLLCKDYVDHTRIQIDSIKDEIYNSQQMTKHFIHLEYLKYILHLL